MFNPVSTYRIQFHKDFTFRNLSEIIPYLQKLGIQTLYASPIFEAVPGSIHGYDVVNPLKINPEIGTEEQLREVSEKLKAHGIRWIQDIVPNHMAFHPNNLWLMDVLEKGRHSVYASFFDLAWTSELFQGRLTVPFLGSSLEDVIAKKEIQIEYFQQRLVFRYYDNTYPLHPRSYGSILHQHDAPDSIQKLIQQIGELHQINDAMTYTLHWHELLLQLQAMMNSEVGNYIDQRLQHVNASSEFLQQIADEQKYKLMHWQTTDEQINFRRFFTISSLIGLNMQDDKVFDHYHRFIRNLVDEGVFQGLRIDHVDGLYNPTAYLQKLRQLVGQEVYIVVEKILQVDEKLPAWPVQGTTGYDFLAYVNNVLTPFQSEEKLSTFYEEMADVGNTQEKIWTKKSYILYHHMGGELNNLFRLLLELNLIDADTLKNIDRKSLKIVLAEFLIRCPVYRFYKDSMPLEEEEHGAIWDILHNIRQIRPGLEAAADAFSDMLLVHPQKGDLAYNERVLKFYLRCMQFTGPLMAKGVEDTLMYTYNRFIGHNEVGDSPVFFGMTTEDFHARMMDRQKHWPLTMNATSTHDTKRGEDVRTRLQILPELADEWIEQVNEWRRMNANLRENNAPDGNDEYFIYQTLVGAYPLEGEDNLADRMEEYLMKSLREGKRNSDWAEPNETYETATITFTKNLLDRKKPFWKSFEKFHQRIADFGIINSLTQLILKFTCPGLPDVYQGCELWDFSLVDPDNRRPIDFEKRNTLLRQLDQNKIVQEQLWESRHNAKIKLWLTNILLSQRNHSPDLFAKGVYIPLKVEGMFKDHILAYALRYQRQWHITIVPKELAVLARHQRKDVLNIRWKDTRVLLPGEAPTQWSDVISTDRKGEHNGSILVKEIFNPLPFALLKLEKSTHERSAGILMHITSLPSRFGVGDLGPQAYAFADFLYRCNQTYWQVLPLNPVMDSESPSPYSSFSAMAGNDLLISPELLAAENLLSEDEAREYSLPLEKEADFVKARQIKDVLFDKAWQAFQLLEDSTLKEEFQKFNSRESWWLEDYALYVVLKKHYNLLSWSDWDVPYRQRHRDALNWFSAEHDAAIQKVKWLQFIFTRQWKKLKAYCESLSIQLIGDLPFYMGYDSVDVWANPEIFSLDEQHKVKGVAGVPPDYFNADGQLWGMPVFCWDVLAQTNYDWWVKRIRKNLEMLDVIRLDHFRAFSGYWEVGASEQTAVNGKWQKGPGSDFFKTLKEKFGELPFIAEDLGEITDDVFQLRDEFELPGMKVLQFAFSDDVSKSIYAPHQYTHPNFFVYTGTHDNNTTRGWYRMDINREIRKRISEYTGCTVNEMNVHAVLMRMAYASTAKTVIVPMQDILGLDEHARMNTPGSITNNWRWRISLHYDSPQLEEMLRAWTKLYGRSY